MMAHTKKPFKRKSSWPVLLAALLSSFFATSVAQDQFLNSGRLIAEPNSVGAQSASLTIVFVSPVFVPAESVIRVTVPEQASLQAETSLPCQLKGIFEISQTCQTLDSKSVTFVLPQGSNIYEQAFNSLIFQGVFFAPLSTKATEPFKVEILDPEGTLLVQDKGDFIMADLVEATIQPSSITQLNSVVVAEPTALLFTITTLNPIPATGGVQIRLPKWNKLAPSGVRESFLIDQFTFDLSVGEEVVNSPQVVSTTESEDLQIDYGALCSAKRGVSADLSCSVYSTSTYDYITIVDMFNGEAEGVTDQGRDAGDTFEFYLNRARNGISMTAVDFEVITFENVAEVTPDGESILGGRIDRGKVQLIAQQAANIALSSTSVSADDSTVQEFSVFYVSFKVPIPVEEGCIVTIQLPEDFKLSAGDIARVQGWGIFGRKVPLNVGIDESARTIKIVDQCARYTGPDTTTEVEISLIQNPTVVRQTDSFKIRVMDQNSKGIASANAGVTYTPTTGDILGIELMSTGGTKIEDLVDIRLDFTPLHSVEGQSFIQVTLPAQIDFTCNVAFTSGLKTAPECELVGFNTLQFKSPFKGDSYGGAQPLTIAFRNRVLPGSNRMVEGIRVETYSVIEGEPFLIDYFDDPAIAFFAPEQQLFINSAVTTASQEVYSMSEFSLTHTLANNLPPTAILQITIPPQIEVASAATVEQSCVATKNLSSDLACTLTQLEDGSHSLVVTGAFEAVGLSKQQEFVLSVSSGMYTPLSMKTSDTFTVVITDQDGYEINYVRQALTVTMKQGKDVGPVSVQVGSQRVGDYTYNRVSFLAPAPLYDGFLIIVNIPEESQAPMNQDFVCITEAPLSATDFGCRINGQRVTITVAVSEDYPGSRIAIGEPLSFQFWLVQNPSSTLPSSPYDVEIKTEKYQVVAVQRTEAGRIELSQPALITQYSFDALDARQQAVTTITIEWTNTQVYPQDLTVLIYYNPDEISPVLADGETSVPCIFSRTVLVNCEYPPEQPGVVKVSNLLSIEQSPGLLQSLTLTQQEIKVSDPRSTQSWVMATFTDETARYTIDKIERGLQFSFKCNFPCLTCRQNDPSYCLSCNYFEEYLILYEGVCSPDCPEQTYKEANQCIPCDDKCKTCAEDNGSICKSCFGGNSDFPFLAGNTCVDECEFGFYGDSAAARCELCESPCESCDGSPTRCMSCYMPPAGEAITEFLYDYDCISSCPAGWVADEPTRSNVCEECSSNCQTCEGTRDRCTTCPAGSKLNLLDQTCVAQCPADITVLVVDPVVGETCEPCDSSCVTCRGSTTFCTQCQDNLSLQATTGFCKLECDESNFTEVSLNGQCVGCSASCETCQHKQDNCLSCIPGKYFYANSCLNKCPLKDGYQYEPTEDGICIIPGIRCDFGYELTPTGNGCALMAQICIEPNELNYDRTTCVPGSDNWVPFPLLALSVIVTLLVVVDKCRHKESRLIANMIVFWSLIEFLGLWVLFYFAWAFGIAPVVYMLGLSILFQIAINLFFYVIFSKQVLNDFTFRHWATYNSCSVRTCKILGLLCNFKVYRLLYSKFNGAKRFDAPFDDPYKFYTPLNVASLMNLVLVKTLCISACIFGIYYVAWGYQLFIECFEYLVIEIIMLLLSVKEYCDLRNTPILAKKPTWKVDAKKVDKMKVMSGFEENLSDDGQDADAYMRAEGRHLEYIRKEVKPKQLKTIHTMEKVLASLLVKKSALREGFENTNQEIDKLHERELMLRNRRRCMSFRQERPGLREAWGFESDEEDESGQNFISEPGSPRSKEMLHNPYFVTRMHVLNKVYTMRDQFDNCYAEAKDPSVWPLDPNASQANKKLQTNVMELLGVDDLVEDTQTQVSSDGAHDIEYDPNQASHLINRVIARIDSDGEEANYATNDALVMRKRRGSELAADNYSSHRASNGGAGKNLPPIDGSRKGPGSKAGKRKRKRLTRRRMAELPNFDVEEILGEFELDDKGNQIILQTANGKLNDRYGRLVNRRGYLIDLCGNVLTRGNVFIFYKEEIDFDDEIPAPYCFQKGSQKDAKFTVKNFSVHRRMRKKDKLAMQDEFIEREYQRLRMAAKSRSGAPRAASQQFSEDGAGLSMVNESERAHYNQRQSDKPHFNQNEETSGMLSHAHLLNENSGAALLGDSQQQPEPRLGDVDLSQLVLSGAGGAGQATGLMGEDDDCGLLSAEAFLAQNASRVNKRRNEAGSITGTGTAQARKGSKHDDLDRVDPEDDDFIDQVTAPMKAKTKGELLGREKALGSRQSSRSRSRSKSGDRSKKHRNKMLNDLSHSQRSFENKQAPSEREIMAMPTAGGDFEDHLNHQIQGGEAVGVATKLPKLNTSSSTKIQARKSARKAGSKGSHSRKGSRPTQRENEQGVSGSETPTAALAEDDEFIRKVQRFNKYLDQRKRETQAQQFDGEAAAEQRSRVAAPRSGIIDDTFLNADGSVRQVGLAHKNLNSVQGRVRSKFNKQIRQGGAALKMRPLNNNQGPSVYRNRLDEPRRFIAGMNHGQRERLLQMEINNLIEAEGDEMSLTSIQRKLGDIHFKSTSNLTPKRGGKRPPQAAATDNEAKFKQLKGIYSDYRLDSRMRHLQQHSPHSQGAGALNFDAARILESDLMDAQYNQLGKQIDADIRKVSHQVQEAQVKVDVKSSLRNSSNGRRQGAPMQPPTTKSHRVGNSSTGRVASQGALAQHEKYL